jgi:hypothetical protein
MPFFLFFWQKYAVVRQLTYGDLSLTLDRSIIASSCYITYYKRIFLTLCHLKHDYINFILYHLKTKTKNYITCYWTFYFGKDLLIVRPWLVLVCVYCLFTLKIKNKLVKFSDKLCKFNSLLSKLFTSFQKISSLPLNFLS